jgi:hypothetical protein
VAGDRAADPPGGRLGVAVAAGPTVSRLRKNWTLGPMVRAKASVPMPTDPPRIQPVVSAVTSSPVRTSRIDPTPRAASPVISPSRGPGPSPAPM